MRLQKTLGATALFLTAIACDQGEVNQRIPLDASQVFRELPAAANGRSDTDSKYQIYSAEYITADGSREIGRTVYFFNVGNKQLDEDFVVGLSLDGTDNVSFYVDETRPSQELNAAATTPAIERAMATWAAVTCSELGMYQRPSEKTVATGYVSNWFGFGGTYGYVADVVHAGWLPAAFFNKLAPLGGTYILGVTFTLTFSSGGVPTDLDNNGKADVAWREIYYNDAFDWAVNGAHNDVETVALHEAGHGLSQDHFGAAFSDAGTGKVHFSPRAVMNAAYTGIQRQIRTTDNAGHCSIWANWPQK